MAAEEKCDDIPNWAVCIVCHMVMYEPRMYQCGHSVCLKCQLQLDSTCPTCKKHSRNTFYNYGLKQAIEAVVGKEHRDEAARAFEEHQVDQLSKKILKSHDVIFTKFDTSERETDLKNDLCAVFRHEYWVGRKKDMHKFTQLCKPYGIRVQRAVYTTSAAPAQVMDASILSEATMSLVPGYTSIVREKNSFVYYAVYHPFGSVPGE